MRVSLRCGRRPGAGAGGRAERGERRLQRRPERSEAQVEGWPGRARAPRLLAIHAPLPSTQRKRTDRPARPRRGRRPPTRPPGQDGGPSAPALPPPRQLAAEPGPPSPGSRPSSAPARRGRFQSAGGPGGRGRGAGPEATAPPPEGEACAPRGGAGPPRAGARVRGMRAPRCSAEIAELSQTRGRGTFWGPVRRGPERAGRLERPGLRALRERRAPWAHGARLQGRGLGSLRPFDRRPGSPSLGSCREDPGPGRASDLPAALRPGTGGRALKGTELEHRGGVGEGAGRVIHSEKTVFPALL